MNDSQIPTSFIWTDKVYEAFEALGVPTHKVHMTEFCLLWEALHSAAGTPAAVLDIAAERRRQREVEGFDNENDDAYANGELAVAAASYTLNAGKLRNLMPETWPWSRLWWKPKGRRRDLERAGALIVAEIERLDREENRP